MSSFFAVTTVWIPLGTEPDWDTADEYIEKLEVNENGVLNLDPLYEDSVYNELVADTPDPAERYRLVRNAIRKDVQELRRHMDEGSREISWSEFNGWKVWITAGISHGDSPTDVMDTIMSLNSIGVLQAAGFYPEGGRWDAVDFNPDCVKGRVSCVDRDLHDELDRVPDDVIREVAKNALAGRDEIWLLALKIDREIAEKAIAVHQSN